MNVVSLGKFSGDVSSDPLDVSWGYDASWRGAETQKLKDTESDIQIRREPTEKHRYNHLHRLSLGRSGITGSFKNPITGQTRQYIKSAENR